MNMTNQFREQHTDAFYRLALADPYRKACCRTCKETKHVSNFYRSRARNTGFGSECKACDKIRNYNRSVERQGHLQKLYGVTQALYNALLEVQKHRCAICGIHQNQLTKRLAVDHCHDRGTIRGLLCNRCNIGLGHFSDNVDYLHNAIKYLEGGNDAA